METPRDLGTDISRRQDSHLKKYIYIENSLAHSSSLCDDISCEGYTQSTVFCEDLNLLFKCELYFQENITKSSPA